MWTFLNPTADSPRDVALKQIIEKFEARNPGVKIKVENQVWFTLAEKFVMAHRARSAPDIGWVNGENMGLLINSNVAEDLGPLITSKWTPAMRRDQVLPQANEWLKKDGKQHALPIMALSIVLFYRRDLFREAESIQPASRHGTTMRLRWPRCRLSATARWNDGGPDCISPPTRRLCRLAPTR